MTAVRALAGVVVLLALVLVRSADAMAASFEVGPGGRFSIMSQAPSAPESEGFADPVDVLARFRSGALNAPDPPQGYFTPHWFVADVTAADGAGPLAVSVWHGLIAQMDLWVYEGDRLVGHTRAGVTLEAHDGWPRFASGYSLPVDVPAGATRTLVVRIEPLMFLATDVELAPADRAARVAELRAMMFPAMIGVFLGVALLHIVLWMRFGDWRNGLFAAVLAVAFLDWFLWLGGPQALGFVTSRDLGFGLIAGAQYALVLSQSLLLTNIFAAPLRRRAFATAAMVAGYAFYIIYPLVPEADAGRFLFATHVLIAVQAAAIAAVATPALRTQAPGTRLALAGAGLTILQSVLVFTPLTVPAMDAVNTVLTAAIGHFDVGHLAVSLAICVLLSLSLWERHRAEMRMRDALAREARLEAVRVAQICHDIRSPLHAVQSLLAALDLDATLPPDGEERLWAARGALGSLRDLVEDIVAAAREGPDGRKAPAPVDLAAVAERAAAAARAEGDGRRVDALVRIAPGAPRRIFGDALALERVIANLAVNAARAARTGPVEVVVEPGARGRVRMTVRDDGPGLPAAARATLLAEEPSRVAPGGIGLVVVRTLADAMGARLAVETTSAGTAISLDVPVSPSDETASTPGGLRLLLIDDDDVTLAATAAMLRADGHEVSTANTARSGVALAAGGMFDAALVDVDLGDESGGEAIRAIRRLRDPVQAGLPMIVTSGHRDIVARARALGAQGILRKPFGPEELRAALAPFAPADVPARSAPLDAAASRLAALSASLPSEDFAEILESARRQIHDCSDIILGDGENAETARRAAHRLAGVAAIVGFEALSRAARSFERVLAREEDGDFPVHRRALEDAARAALAALEDYHADPGAKPAAVTRHSWAITAVPR